MSKNKQVEDVRTRKIIIPGDRYFPEGVTVAADGTIYVGSMYEGCIMRSPAGETQMEPFIESGTNGLVSVLGLWADDNRNILWACSSDAGNGKLTGSSPVGVKAFELHTGEPKGSYDFPGSGFANDLNIEGGAGGIAVITVHGDSAEVRRLPAGLNGVSTFAIYNGSAWVVESQSDHFWDPANAGPDANPPFRIVEVPME